MAKVTTTSGASFESTHLTDDATGTGALVLQTSPTLITPALGVATATSLAVAGGTAQSLLNNFNTVAQSISATTRTILVGSTLSVPTALLRIGTILRFKFAATKTAAGSASSTVDIAIGTAGTTADTAILSFTKPAGTAAADEAFFEIDVIVRGPLSASGVLVGQMRMTHNLAATGHAQIPVVVVNTVSSTFDVTTAALKVSVALTTGASDAITVQMVTAEAINL